MGAGRAPAEPGGPGRPAGVPFRALKGGGGPGGTGAATGTGGGGSAPSAALPGSRPSTLRATATSLVQVPGRPAALWQLRT